MARFIKIKAIKVLAHERGKRVSRSFVLGLDARVQRVIEQACRNTGSKKTLIDDDLIRT